MSAKTTSRSMTAVRILEPGGADYVEVVFLESAQFYRLPKGNPAFNSMIATLRNAMAKQLAVEIQTASLASSIIEAVKSANAG